MGKIVAIVVIAIAIWLTYSPSAQENFKKKALGIMSQEKTVNSVNSARESTQRDINGALNR